jgi:hypothetical protein
MTRDELVARMSSQELTAWMALFNVHAEEAQRQRDILESGDGHVYVSGLEDEDDELRDGDGAAE